MDITRRDFLKHTTCMAASTMALASLPAFAGSAPKIRLSACDWSFGVFCNPKGLARAESAGLDGLEVSVGSAADTLKIADPALRQSYKDAIAKTGVSISSTAMGSLLNGSPFATDERAPAWLDQSIEATADLGVQIMLMAFFGKGDLREKDGTLKKACVDSVVERLKEGAPKAEKLGVILGLENTLSAKDNLAILDRVQSDAVRVYYDVRNSTSNGYDAPAEIRQLKDLICQIHFKDGKHFLGEGPLNWEPVAEAIRDIKYKGWYVLETSAPSKDRIADFKRNGEYVRNLMATA
ncbi:MAG: TIM barrel protein [bacterium]|nr:TIM barrel protein [bacterium]